MSLPECVNLFEIVAPVESVEETGMVGYGKRPEMLKFVIENDDGREIQCIARNEQIMRLKPLIKINEMIHMRKFISRRDSLACFASEAPLVLTIDRSTVIKLAKDNGKNDVDERFRSIHEPKTIRFGVPPSESWGSLSQQIL